MKNKYLIRTIERPFVSLLYAKSSISISTDKNNWRVLMEIEKAMEKPGDYEITIAPKSNKRSLDANAFLWVLIGKIAEFHKLKPTDVYRREVVSFGKYDVLCLQENALPDFKQHWESNGEGWQIVPFESKIKGCINVKAYYGTSVYTSAEMSRFIDLLIEECNQIGVYVDTEELREVKREL